MSAVIEEYSYIDTLFRVKVFLDLELLFHTLTSPAFKRNSRGTVR